MTDGRQRRRVDVKSRAKQPDHAYGFCRVIGCPNPARAGTSDGLDHRYCRAHADRIQRHGSPIKDSYSAGTLNPYRRAAFGWLEANAGDPYVQAAMKSIRGLYDRAGQHIEAFRLRGLGPKERAKAAWARLRKEGVSPLLPLAAWLAVEMAIQDDLQPVLTAEYKQVQAAKLVHRMASGSHKRWANGMVVFNAHDKSKMRVSNELHVYPKSRGRVLRWLGVDLEKAAELLVEHRLEAIRAFKAVNAKTPLKASRPHPRKAAVRRRKPANQRA